MGLGERGGREGGEREGREREGETAGLQTGTSAAPSCVGEEEEEEEEETVNSVCRAGLPDWARFRTLACRSMLQLGLPDWVGNLATLPVDSGLSAHFLGGSPGSAGEERSCYVCSVMDGQEGQEFCSGIPAFTAESASHTTCV